MKKILIYLACTISSLFASGNNTLGIPNYLYTCTYAINDYENQLPEEPRSNAHSNRFVSEMRARMAQYMPSVYFVHYDSARNREANIIRLSNNANTCEMVQFSGHGYPNQYVIWPNSTPGTYTFYANPIEKSFGGWTRWVLLHDCQTLKRGISGLTDNSATGYKYWFGGAHAVLGHRANSYWFYERDCGLFGCDRYRSEEFYDSFANYWAPGYSTIWESWHFSYRDRIYSRGYSGSPSIVFMTYNIGNGTIVAGRDEQSDLQYSGDFNAINYSNAPVDNLYRSYIDYGTPDYSPLSPPLD